MMKTGSEYLAREENPLGLTTCPPQPYEKQQIASGPIKQWNGPKFQPTGRKDDSEKSRVDLLDPEFLLEMGKVMGFGAQKYDSHNWRNGIVVSRLIASAMRHLLAICRGEDIDRESGRSHAAHLGCCAMLAYWILKHRPELDDRYKY